jgi:hypothetical protein
VAYTDWRLMTRWQRNYHLRRMVEDTKTRVKAAQKGLSGLIGAVVSRILGA